MSTIINYFADLCFPPDIYCIACDNLIDNTRMYSLCDRCIKEIKWNIGRTCPKCGKAIDDDFEDDLCHDCQKSDHLFRKGFSCVTYEGWGKKVVQNMKYKDRAYIAKNIGEIMKDRGIEITSSLLVPVPMNITKKNKRGYNQSELIAENLAKKTGTKCESNLLRRKKETTAMSSLSREQRKLSLQNEFYISKYDAERINGSDVLLIDDVFTTGSTANACVEVLLRAGVVNVDLFVFASGDNLRV